MKVSDKPNPMLPMYEPDREKWEQRLESSLDARISNRDYIEELGVRIPLHDVRFISIADLEYMVLYYNF